MRLRCPLNVKIIIPAFWPRDGLIKTDLPREGRKKREARSNNFPGGAHNSQETFQEHRAQVSWKTVPLSSTRRLHHKTITTSLGFIADLSNTQKQNVEKRKIPQTKEQEKFPGAGGGG